MSTIGRFIPSLALCAYITAEALDCAFPSRPKICYVDYSMLLATTTTAAGAFMAPYIVTSKLKDVPKKVKHLASSYLYPKDFKLSIPDHVNQNDLIAIEVFLENGGSLKDRITCVLLRRDKEETLIEFAIRYGTPEMVEFLLSRERDIDPELQNLCIKGLLKTEKFSEMIELIVEAGIISDTLILIGKEREFFNVLIKQDQPEIALNFLRNGNIPYNTQHSQITILQKIANSTDDEKTAKYLALYKELIQSINSKIEDDVRAYTKGHPVLFKNETKIELADLRRERLQKERIINPFELARSFGEDGERLVELAMEGEVEDLYLAGKISLLGELVNDTKPLEQLLEFFKAGSSKPQVLFALEQMIAPCGVIIDGKR